jgi:hypothetical protein
MRTCRQCGAVVAWGLPQCLNCGAWTVWRRLLAGFGLLVGAGGVLAVLGAVVRVALLPPPPEVRAGMSVERFLQKVAETPEVRRLVKGAGPCRDKPEQTLCVQVGAELNGFDDEGRRAVRRRLEELWAGVLEEAPPSEVVLIGPGGRVLSTS